MSEAYERERQNNSRLDELSAKVSALRGVTIDIYDNAREQGVIDSTVRIQQLLLRGTVLCPWAVTTHAIADLTFPISPTPFPQ